ncbi:MAG: type II toxin-antitoxin system VapC family toxin [Treponema sp.]|nr:type II toxin-antitoxin system VapC family toxin [Treponema sp.]
MTSYLVDTHILLWVLVDSEKLPVKVREIIYNPNNEIYYSVASMWEVAIKYSKGKLPISGAMFLHYCEQAGFKKLPVDERHVLTLENLTRQDGSPPHKDPFDKVMLAQAKADSMLFMTHDRQFTYYNEPWVVMV